MLLLAAMLVLAAFGASAADLQPSALRVVVAAVVALLAPMFWPGKAATLAATARRIAGWSVAAAGAAAIALRILGPQPYLRILGTCTMLLFILLLTHAAAAAIEQGLGGRPGAAEGGREIAGRTAALGLALLGTLPLWFGPGSELLSRRHPWVIDAAIGISPLTHLAVASGNDLLRNQWLYQHSNLAALPFSYPELAGLTALYAAVCLVLALLAFASRHRLGLQADAPRNHPTTEKIP